MSLQLIMCIHITDLFLLPLTALNVDDVSSFSRVLTLPMELHHDKTLAYALESLLVSVSPAFAPKNGQK